MVLAAYVLLCLIWSSTWLIITFVIRDVPPVTGAAARFWVAAFVYLLIHLIRPIKLPRSWARRLAILGLGAPQIGISYACVYWAEMHIASGMTSVLFATYPFVVAIVSARIAAGEVWSRRKLIGLICGLAGVAVVFFDQWLVASTTAVIAVGAVLLASISCGITIVLIKKHFTNEDTFGLTALQLLGGAIALTVIAFAFESPFQAAWTAPAAWATLYLAVVASAIAFFGYYWLLRHVEGTTAATITFVTPLLAVIWGWVFADERITWSLILGGGLVLSGVWSVAVSARTKPLPAIPTQIPPVQPETA